MSQLGSQDEEREEPKKTVRQDSVELEKQKEDLKQFHKTFNVREGAHRDSQTGAMSQWLLLLVYHISICYSANSWSASTNIDQSHSRTFECN